MNPYLVFLIGIAAQILFSGRLLVQWIASERAKKVLSPTLFWQMSMAASFMLCVYGWLRNDFAIIAGQLISYYIYIWNLRAKKAWDTMPAVLRAGGVVPAGGGRVLVCDRLAGDGRASFPAGEHPGVAHRFRDGGAVYLYPAFYLSVALFGPGPASRCCLLRSGSSACWVRG